MQILIALSVYLRQDLQSKELTLCAKSKDSFIFSPMILKKKREINRFKIILQVTSERDLTV